MCKLTNNIGPVLFLAGLLGCGSHTTSAPSSPPPIVGTASTSASTVISDAALTINGVGKEASNGDIHAMPSGTLEIKGSYRLPPGAHTGGVYFQIASRRNGKEIIVDSGAVMPKQEADRVTFEGSLKAPDKAGTYELLARDGETVIAVTPVEVKAN